MRSAPGQRLVTDISQASRRRVWSPRSFRPVPCQSRPSGCCSESRRLSVDFALDTHHRCCSLPVSLLQNVKCGGIRWIYSGELNIIGEWQQLSSLPVKSLGWCFPPGIRELSALLCFLSLSVFGVSCPRHRCSPRSCSWPPCLWFLVIHFCRLLSLLTLVLFQQFVVFPLLSFSCLCLLFLILSCLHSTISHLALYLSAHTLRFISLQWPESSSFHESAQIYYLNSIFHFPPLRPSFHLCLSKRPYN